MSEEIGQDAVVSFASGMSELINNALKSIPPATMIKILQSAQLDLTFITVDHLVKQQLEDLQKSLENKSVT